MTLKANLVKVLLFIICFVGLAFGQTNLKDETSIINFLCKQYQVEYLHKDLKDFRGAGFNSYSDLKTTGLDFAPFGQFDLDSIFTIDQRKALEENLTHTTVRRIRNSEPPKKVKLMEYDRGFKKGEVFGFSRILVQDGKDNFTYAIVLVSKGFAQDYWSEWYLILRKEGDEWREIYRTDIGIS